MIPRVFGRRFRVYDGGGESSEPLDFVRSGRVLALPGRHRDHDWLVMDTGGSVRFSAETGRTYEGRHR